MTSCLGSRLARPHIRVETATCGHRFFKYGEKISVFENTRLRVDGQIPGSKTLHVDADFFLNTEGKISVFENTPAMCERGLYLALCGSLHSLQTLIFCFINLLDTYRGPGCSKAC